MIKEQAIFLDGTMGYIVPMNVQLTDEIDGEWVCQADGKFFEYQNNLWVEA